MSILKEINSEVQDFRNKNITIVPGLTFNQRETIERIYFYYNSKFSTGDVDDEGDRKYFYNINKNPCKVFSKAIDFDTKNIRLLTTGGGNPEKTWFMERDLKYWMRDKQFGKTLNRLFKEMPIFGSVVLKMVDGTPYFVDLRNFVVEQSADDLESSNYLIEVHNLTPANFRKIGKQMKWDETKIEQTVDLFHQMKDTSHIRLYERYGEVCDTAPDGSKTYTYKRVFVADVGVNEYDQRRELTLAYPGIELSAEVWKGHPYWEFHAEKISGRWLGIGVVEALFEPQIKQNETVNLESKSAYFLSLHVFQTRDPSFNRNLSNGVVNGETFNVDSEVTEVAINDRNSAFFNEQTNKWMRNRDELSFSYDAVQGERSPAGTPLGSVQISVGQTLSYFEQIQENIAMDVKEMIYTDIIPRFQTDNTAEHTLRLIGSDLDTYISMVKNNMTLKEIIRQALNNPSRFPTNKDRDVIGIAIESSIKQGKEKILTIPKDFYKDVKYDIDIDITGESVDTRVRSATRFAILQAITADPTATTDPIKKKIIAGMAEDGGINPNEFFGVETRSPEQMTQGLSPVSRAGGGVSAPALGGAIPGQATQTVA
jgi:hypothetical protein